MGPKMSSQNLTKLTPEDAREIPMVDLAFAVLKNVNNPMYYRDLMTEIAKIKVLSDDEVMQVIAQVYTEINIDGRFACVGNNLWGLKRWYPVEKAEDALGNTRRPRIINDEDDDLDDDEIFGEEEVELDEEGNLVDEDDDEERDVERTREAQGRQRLRAQRAHHDGIERRHRDAAELRERNRQRNPKKRERLAQQTAPRAPSGCRS